MKYKVDREQEIKDMLIQSILLIDLIHYSEKALENKSLEEIQEAFNLARKQQLEE